MEWFCHVSYQPNQRNIYNIAMLDEDRLNTNPSMVYHYQDFQCSKLRKLFDSNKTFNTGVSLEFKYTFF